VRFGKRDFSALIALAFSCAFGRKNGFSSQLPVNSFGLDNLRGSFILMVAIGFLSSTVLEAPVEISSIKRGTIKCTSGTNRQLPECSEKTS